MLRTVSWTLTVGSLALVLLRIWLWLTLPKRTKVGGAASAVVTYSWLPARRKPICYTNVLCIYAAERGFFPS